jgi:shikimate kinase
MAMSSGKASLNKTVALVGMMGAGKTSIGRRLAARLEVGFCDADHEIETAAGMTVAEIFAKYGEPEFRRLERSVIARLLGETPHVLATGGGAYMDDGTREAMRAGAFTIWLKAPIDILLGRVKKRQEQDKSRSLLDNDDMRGTLERLLAVRGPVYAQADMTLESFDEPHAVLLDKIVAALKAHGLCECP